MKPISKTVFSVSFFSYQCAYDCAQLCYTIQHSTVLIIFPLILQTIIIAQMLSSGSGPNGTKMATNTNAILCHLECRRYYVFELSVCVDVTKVCIPKSTNTLYYKPLA